MRPSKGLEGALHSTVDSLVSVSVTQTFPDQVELGRRSWLLCTVWLDLNLEIGRHRRALLAETVRSGGAPKDKGSGSDCSNYSPRWKLNGLSETVCDASQFQTKTLPQ